MYLVAKIIATLLLCGMLGVFGYTAATFADWAWSEFVRWMKNEDK